MVLSRAACSSLARRGSTTRVMQVARRWNRMRGFSTDILSLPGKKRRRRFAASVSALPPRASLLCPNRISPIGPSKRSIRMKARLAFAEIRTGRDTNPARRACCRAAVARLESRPGMPKCSHGMVRCAGSSNGPSAGRVSGASVSRRARPEKRGRRRENGCTTSLGTALCSFAGSGPNVTGIFSSRWSPTRAGKLPGLRTRLDPGRNHGLVASRFSS